MSAAAPTKSIAPQAYTSGNTPPPPPKPKAGDKIEVTNPNGLEIRSGAGTNFAAVDTLKQGGVAIAVADTGPHPNQIQDKQGNWWDRITAGGRTGWIEVETAQGAVYAVDAPKPANPAVVSPGRRAQIDEWLSQNDHATGGFLGFGQTSAAEHIQDALDGKTQLGPLSGAEQRYLVDRALADPRIGPSDAADLAQRVQGDERVRGPVAEGLVKRAVFLRSQPGGNGSLNDPHGQARAYALDALQAMNKDASGLGRIISGLPPKDGALFAQALGNGMVPEPELSYARDQVLSALNRAPRTDTTGAVVQNLFAETLPGDFVRTPALAQDLATALAREWYPDSGAKAAADASRLGALLKSRPGELLLFGGSPYRNLTALAAVREDKGVTEQTLQRAGGDPAKSPEVARAMANVLVPPDAPNRAATVSRFAGILGTDQGQQLFFGSVGSQVPSAANLVAQQAIFSDPSITANTLAQTSDPWTNPALVMDIAQANDANFRNDTPQRLTGSNLDNAVGIAMGIPPTLPKGMNEQQLFAQLSTGKLSLYAGGSGRDAVRKVVSEIRTVGGANPLVTVLPITFSSGDYGPVQLPLFRVQTPQNGVEFVDNLGRRYASFQDWKDHNQLPSGLMVYAEGGRLQTDRNGNLKLASGNTPKANDTAGRVLDTAAMIGGIIAGGALILGTGGLATAAVGSLCAVWGAVRSVGALHDRADHGQSINPFASGTARGLWLGLAANATGVAAFGSEAALASLVKEGGTLGDGSAFLIGGMRTAATVTNGVAFGNAGVDLATHWGKMSPDQRAAAVLQMGFWGMTSAVGAREASSLSEMFNPVAAARAVMEAYQPVVVRDATLGGSRVEIRMTEGRPVVYAGEKATENDIQLHISIARLMARDQGLSGMIQRLIGEPSPGTLAYSVKYENIKLGRQLDEMSAALQDPNLAPQRRAELNGEIESIRAYLNQLSDSFQRIAAHPTDAGIAAPSTGAARADQIQPGLADELRVNHPGYYFRDRGVNEVPEIVRPSESDPILALVKDNESGRWVIQKVSNQPNLPKFSTDFGSRSIGENLKNVSLNNVPDAQGLEGKFQELIQARDAEVKQRDALLKAGEVPAANEQEYNVLNQKVVDLSRQIGELGAIAFVNSEYPGAKLIYGGPGQGSRPGDFDLVFSYSNSSQTKYVVVEAKGGSSPLGTRRVGSSIETQGTQKYFEDILASMKNMGGTAEDVAIQLDKALRTNDIVYLTTRAGVNSVSANVSTKQFDIGSP